MISGSLERLFRPSSSISPSPSPSFPPLPPPPQSYGGHYVPWLARAVIQYNDHSPPNPINLKGFMVGNAWTDPKYDNYGAATFW